MVRKQYKSYPKYKDAGIEWLGKVPEGWDIKKLKYLAKIETGSTPKKSIEENYTEEGEGVLWAKPDNLYGLQPTTDTSERLSKMGCSNMTIIPEGAVLVGCIGNVGKMGVAGHDLTTNQQINSVITNDSFSNNFAKYILLSSEQEMKRNSNTVVVAILNKTGMSNIPYSLPPLSEQEKIAKFLDTKVGDIDSLVAKLEEQLKLIDEQRNSLITETVCKGLNPNAKMKNSGIQWLGKIPEHWKIKRLKYISILNPSKNEISDKDKNTEVSFVPMEKISVSGVLELDENKTISEVYTGFTYFKNKDVLLAKITPCFENGKGGLADNLTNGIGFGTTEFFVFRAKENILPKYIYFITKTNPFKEIGKSEMRGVAGQQRVTNEFISNFKLGIPLLHEQESIVKYLDEKLTKIDELKTKTIKQIELLKEYKISLITNAVTGKIDVRDEVI